MPQIKTLQVELKKLSDICLNLKPWVEAGLLDYRRIESEESILRAEIEKLKKERDEAQEGIKKAIQNADMILAQARAEEQRIKAEISTLWVRAQSKFDEVEKRIDQADRKAIEKQIKTLVKEEVAA